MTAAEIIAIIQLAASLEPTVITLINQMVTAFESITPEERTARLTALQASLKPMTAKV
jgi:hypothetical protein